MADSLESKRITIFKLAAGDSSAAVSANKIDFNVAEQSNTSNFKKGDKEGAYITSIQKKDTEGIGNNQTAEQTDGNKQALGVVNGTYIIKGFITNTRGNSDNGTNAFLVKLQEWKDAVQQIKTQWEAGVMGIEDKNDSTNTLLPTRTDEGGGPALIFVDFDKINDINRNRSDFTLTFRRSRGIIVGSS